MTLGLKEQPTFLELLLASPGLQAVVNIVRRAAPSDAPVLIVGESGTGKELVARALHELSGRRDAPFLSLNLAAVPVELADAALFGHAKGAFTGASQSARGYCRAAHQGTLLLDEITETSLSVQTKLLRFLQNQEVQEVGSDEVDEVDVRVLAATNRIPEVAIHEGVLREDLFHRLNIVQIRIPPLRERPQDVDVLVRHFIVEFNAKYRRQCTITQPAQELLRRFEWHGNVRQLRGLIESLIVLAESDTIGIPDLPDEVLTSTPATMDKSIPAVEATTILEQHTQRLVVDILEQADGNVTEAARRLGIGRSTLYRRLKKCVER